MTTRNQQSWGVGALAAIAIVLAFAVVVLTGAVMASAPSGSFSISSPDGGFREDQSWTLFAGGGAQCHVEFWSENNNRSIHSNTLIVADNNGQVTTLAVERFQGTTDRATWDSLNTGAVYMALVLGGDQVSSADYFAEWHCEEPPPETTLPPETTTTAANTTTTVPDTTTTVAVTTTTAPTPGTTTSTTTSTTTTQPSTTTTVVIPSAIPTGIG